MLDADLSFSYGDGRSVFNGFRFAVGEGEKLPWKWEREGALVVFLLCNVVLGTAFGPIRDLIQQGLNLF